MRLWSQRIIGRMASDDGEDSVRAAIAAFDRAFAAGDAAALAALFTDDARLLLLYGPPFEGRAAIQAQWAKGFARFDTSAWLTEPLIVDVHGDSAYTLSTYSETLVPREPGLSQSVLGRVVLFWRRDPGGPWRIVLCMNSHVRPIEDIPE